MKKGCLLVILGLFLCVGQAFAIDLPATEDAYVFGGRTANVINLATGGGGYASLLKFDVSSVSGQTITAATLNLYRTGYTPIFGTAGTTAYYAQDGWTESSIPAAIISGATIPIGSLPTGGPAAAWATYNLLPLLQGYMLTDGTLSIAIHPTGSSFGNQDVFASSEYFLDPSLRPYLSVTTAAAPVPEPATMLLLGLGLIGLAGMRRKKM